MPAFCRKGFSMKKKIPVILFIIVVLVFSLSLMTFDPGERLSYPWEIEKADTDYFNSDENVNISLKEETLRKNRAAFKILNNSDTEIFFGQDFSLQIFKSGKWYDIIVPPGKWTANKSFVKPQTGIIIDVKWEDQYGELPYGKYRLVKEYSKGSEPSYMLCEFEMH